MKKRFIVLVNSGTAEQNEAFRTFVRDKKLGWWHWLSNSWLVVDSSGSTSATDIRDALLRIYPAVNNMVLEFSDTDDMWSGFGPKTEKKDMFEWLKKNWNRES